MAELLLNEVNSVKTYLVEDSKWGSTVIKKVLDILNPTEKQVRDFLFEYNLLKEINMTGIRKPVTLEKDNAKEAAFYEYFDGITLSKLIQAGQNDLSFTLRAGIFLASALENLHQKGIIHKSISSHNILFNPDNDQFCLIDFSHASTFYEKKHHLGNPSYLTGDLAYISPEQTGRMNRKIDARSDLYSTGIVLYELLTFVTPFSHPDAIEIVHGHIARNADIVRLNKVAPGSLSRIIEKLLNKDAESRYQSAVGLKFDLEKCLNEFQNSKKISNFEIATKDFSTELRISQRLYGRDEEITILESEFEKVVKGASGAMMVTGYSGVGKSALIYEVYKSISRARGYFIKGKFDQFQRNIPYYAISQALKEYVTFILTEPEDLINRIRTTIIEALGSDGKLITDIIPTFELIIGPQSEVPILAAVESQNRFMYAFQRLIRSITLAGNPVVMFIDDLQWADLASLQLISGLLRDHSIRNFLFVGSYRDNEVNEIHPLAVLVTELKMEEVSIKEIELTGLTLNDVIELLSESLSKDHNEVRTLANIIYQRTLGNAFYVNQVLSSLYEDGILRVDPISTKWEWNEIEVEDLRISDNVVDLLIKRLQKLEPGTQKLLQTAACIGNSFTREQLDILLKRDGLSIQKSITNALEQELIQEQENEFLFIHDKIQQAVYSTINIEERAIIHLEIGRRLLEEKGNSEEALFDIVNQFNIGRRLVIEPEERLKLAGMNLRAGIKAKRSTAYGSSIEYLSACKDFIADDWHKHYELLLSLHSNAAEAAHLCGDYNAVDQHVDIVIKNAKGLLDKIPVYKAKIESLKSENRLAEAVEKGLEILSLLGIKMPYAPSKIRVMLGLLFIKLVVAGRNADKFLHHKKMKDPYKLACMQILVSIGPAIYWASPNLTPLTIFNMVRLSIRFGNTDESIFAYSTYGLVLCGITGEINSGNQFGKLALALSNQVNATNGVKGIFNTYCFVHHWQNPISQSIEPFRQNFHSGLQIGDLEFAALSAYLYCNHSFHDSHNLERLDTEMSAYCTEIRQIKQYTPLNYNLLYWQTVKCLRGESKDPTSFNGPIYDEAEKLPIHQNANDSTALFKYHLLKQMLLCLYHKYDQALEHAQEGGKYLAAVTGMYVTPVYYYYYGISLAGQLHVNKNSGSSANLIMLEKIVAKMKKWAHFSPENHSHKFHLLKAELFYVLSDTESAQKHYRIAIKTAEQNSSIQDEALSNELAGRFYFHMGDENLANHFFLNAFTAYKIWGASSKCQDISNNYRLHKVIEKYYASLTPLVKLKGDGSVLQSIDIQSVVKASTTISQEIEFDLLKKQLMRILVENVGAERGVLLIPEGNKLKVEKQWPDSDKMSYAGSIVKLVSKSKEIIVSGNAEADQKYSNDPHIVNEKVKSLLCIPVIHQSELMAIIYLENNLIFGAFSPERMETLKLLSGQIAISLKNATLYKNLSDSHNEQVMLKEAYSRFVPVEFLKFLDKNSIVDVRLGDQVQKEVTIMFIDIIDYTSLSEKMTPKENFDFINEWIKKIGPLIESKGGFICQFLGDGLMAIFKDEPERAVESAIMIQQEVHTVSIKKANTEYSVSAGIGLHTGNVMLGIIGDTSRLDQNVISDNVNIASRVQDLTRYFGSSILVTRQMLDHLSPEKKDDFRRLGKVKVRGKTYEIEVFENLEGFNKEQALLRKNTKPVFDKGLELFYSKEFSSAAVKFEQVLHLNSEDKAARNFLERAVLNMAQGVSDDWTGSDILEHK